MRNWLLKHYEKELQRKMDASKDRDYSKSAIIFAPHQDDETLGCGGTIAKKIQAGAQVWVIFLTDGCRSHSHLMDAEQLKAKRIQEAIAACKVLGVPQERVKFLGFTNGDLLECQAEAAQAVAKYLNDFQPEEVYIPHCKEGPPDHRATNLAVWKALKQTGLEATVFEYPVWMWHHWPWVPFQLQSLKATLKGLNETMQLEFGRLIAREFDEVVAINDYKSIKREALEQHATQMTRFNGEQNWAILSDVSNGEWLACFFRDYEVFSRNRG